MKNSTLVFRSLGIIIFLAGLAHLFSFGVEVSDDSPTPTQETNSAPLEESEAATPSETPSETSVNDPESDFLIDKWQVSYKTEDYNGAIIYDIKKEDKTFNAYLHQYVDQMGYAVNAEGDKVLTVTKFNGRKGKGIYTITYEGEQYEVACKLARVDENTFSLSYDYYGYADVETWKRH